MPVTKFLLALVFLLLPFSSYADVLQAYPEPTATALYGYNGSGYSIIRMPNLIRPVRYLAVAVYPTGYGGTSYLPERIEIFHESSGVPWENCTGWNSSSTATGCFAPRVAKLTLDATQVSASHVALVGNYHIYDLGTDVYLSSFDSLVLTWDRSSLSLQKMGDIINIGATYTSNPYSSAPVGNYSPSIFLCDTLTDCAVTWWDTDYNAETYNALNLDTKFTQVSNFSFSSSTKTVSFDVEQYINLPEIQTNVAEKNITNHYVTYNPAGVGGQNYSAQGFAFTPTQGLSSTTITLTDSAFVNDGVFNFKINFGNQGTGITDIFAFPDTYLYFTAHLASGTVTSVYYDDAYYPDYVNTGDETGFSCGISLLSPSSYWPCITAYIKYLIIPRPGALSAMAWYSQGSSSPVFAFVSKYATLSQDAIDSFTYSTTSLTSLDMSIPIVVASTTIMTIPIMSLTEFDERAGNADEFFRLLCLGTLVLFAFYSYLGQVRSAWHVIALRKK